MMSKTFVKVTAEHDVDEKNKAVGPDMDQRQTV